MRCICMNCTLSSVLVQRISLCRDVRPATAPSKEWGLGLADKVEVAVTAAELWETVVKFEVAIMVFKCVKCYF
jgi:hypothetical protein